MIVPFRQQAAQAQPEGPQPDPNFLLMAAGMMQKEQQEANRKGLPADMIPPDGGELREHNELLKQALPGKPEGEFIAPSGLDLSGADHEQTNRLNKELTKITKPSPKERSI